jgi:hypothetical protein
MKSLTQMSKKELIDEIRNKEVTIADLNAKIDELELMAIQSSATPIDADASQLIGILKTKIEQMEAQINGE